MLGANRAAMRLCEILWQPLSPCYSNLSLQKAMRHRFSFSVLPYVVPGTECLGLGQPSNWFLLMQWCSFSQSRIYSAQSEIKEDAMSGQDLAQVKRCLDEKVSEELSEKRLRLTDHKDNDTVVEAAKGLDTFAFTKFSWPQFDLSDSRSRHDVVPIYEASSLSKIGEDIATQSNTDEEPLEGIRVEESKEILSNKVHNLRQWQYTGFNEYLRQKSSMGIDFTLMSYNILAQDLLEDNFYLYGHCDQNVLGWEFRSRNLLEEIEESQPDIICLQELQEIHYEDYFRPYLSALGFDSLYKKRTGNKPDGCGIFFKKSLFKLDSYACVEYFKPGIQHLDRDNVGLIAVLKPIGAQGHDDTKLCIATTHLLFNPRRGDIKLSQLQLLLAELDRVAFKGKERDGSPSYHPTILCGDMNSEPYSPLYEFLTKGELMYDGLMAGNVSGQKEGVNRGKMIHSMDLHLPQLGVSLDCQYTHLRMNRMEPSSTCASISQMVSDTRTNPDYYSAMSLWHTNPLPMYHQTYEEVSSTSNVPPPASCLRHKFDFVSTYGKKGHRGEVVTTHHRKASCIVDYIFYSIKSKLRQKQEQHREGPLYLVGTRQLPTSEEVANLGGLPNAALSSDHLSLIAKFFLSLSGRS